MGVEAAAGSSAVSSPRFRSIDGLRGFCALYVVVFHLLVRIKWENPFITRLVFQGPACVPLFFAISGFLLYPRLARDAETDPHWCARYFVRRAARILPLWWAILLAWDLTRGMSTRVLLTNVFMVFGFVSYDRNYLPIIPAWSLFVELWFYLLLPVMLRFLRSGQDVALTMVGSVILANVWQTYAARWGVPTNGYYVGYSPIANFQYFFVGIAIAFTRDHWSSSRWDLGALPRGPALILDAVGVLCFFAPVFLVGLPLVIGVAALLIAVASGRGVLSKAFQWPPLTRAGELCYAIYLLHAPLGSWLAYPKFRLLLLTGWTEDTLQLRWLPLFLVIVYLLAEASGALWERPWQRLGARLAAKIGSRQAIASCALNSGTPAP